MLNNKTIFLTGGTGSFGNHFTSTLIKKYKFKKLIIFSRDEIKQWDMRKKFEDKRIKFIIGDVRDSERVLEASKNSEIIIHAAATKIVPTAEEFPSECIKTNVLGAMNIISAAKKNNVQKVIALSTDKACNPINLYGATKLTSDKLFISNNEYKKKSTRFSIVRYGNVISSRGSVIPFFRSFKKNELIPITHVDMTRFMLTLDDAVKLVIISLKNMRGGEIFVKKCPSIRLLDIAKAINEKFKFKIIGIRPGEKIHEEMISKDDSRNTYEFKSFFKILPDMSDLKNLNLMKKKGKKVPLHFSYSSINNAQWLKYSELKKIIQNIK